jgi:endoglucanase Acf2
MFAHPLALRAEARGLRVAYPGASIAVNKTGIVGGMPGGDSDIVLGHSQAAEFPDARCDGWSDWFVSALFQQGASTLRASFGHGSPFVFALFEGGEPRLQFAQPPRVWSGDPTTPTVGISIGGRHWGLFAPRGSSWQEEGDRAWRCRTNGKGYFSLALLPDDRPETLRLFARHAHAHVVGSRVDWRYDAPASRVHTRFSFETRRMEAPEAPEAAPENGAADDANNADGEATLFALYPHQWTRLAAEAEKSLLPHGLPQCARRHEAGARSGVRNVGHFHRRAARASGRRLLRPRRPDPPGRRGRGRGGAAG